MGVLGVDGPNIELKTPKWVPAQTLEIQGKIKDLAITCDPQNHQNHCFGRAVNRQPGQVDG